MKTMLKLFHRSFSVRCPVVVPFVLFARSLRLLQLPIKHVNLADKNRILKFQ